MVAFAWVPFVLAGVSLSSVGAVPLEGLITTASIQGTPVFPPINYGLLCELPLLKEICAIVAGETSSNVQVTTPIGVAQGVADGSGAHRYPVKYASATRWATSTLATKWTLPTGATNASGLPLACPQPSVDPSTYVEDCLSMILYVPSSLKVTSGVPTLLWIHGGSFISGSATGPGLDGSKLAIATNSIVAVMQYRLGALGFMAPNGATNLAVKDTINAMNFLAKVVPSFGGSASKITLAGQSSGAGMIRAILATPSASSLFQSAILQSDPIDYGFLNTSTQVALQSSFNTLTGCAATNTACQRALSLDSILDAQVTLGNNAPSIDPSTGSAEPIRPVRDGSLITTPLDLTAAFPSVKKPILLSNVRNEAGPTIYGMFAAPLTPSTFDPVCEASLGDARTATVTASPFYNSNVPDIRVPLETLGTDYVWRCPTWTLARSWVGHGGTAFVGVYYTGATYPANNGIAFCLEAGSVCHQDDIEIVFGTVPSPTAAQAALTTEMQSRYKAFLTTGSPNVAGLIPWTAATTTDVHAHQLGGTPSPSGEVAIGACDPSFWGAAVDYDYQVFGI
ncbi:alpha/beta-hydrolase [Mycena galopus ATCC 62051]|nr:alpha/beta-hydrolase [Mycena galopus ATCC 62051]